MAGPRQTQCWPAADEFTGICGLYWMLLAGCMVGHEGFEPSTPTSRT